jgi:uncharacterized protein with PIN domain
MPEVQRSLAPSPRGSSRWSKPPAPTPARRRPRRPTAPTRPTGATICVGAPGRRAEAFLRGTGVLVEPVTLEHGELARQAFLELGEGRHKACLDFGDCFSYALAKATGEALLYKGGDFALTDIRSG